MAIETGEVALAEDVKHVARPVRKTADESVNNTTTLQNDDELLFALAANEKWAFDAYLAIICEAGAAQYTKGAFTVPTGATLYWTVIFDSSGPASTYTALASGASILIHLGATSIKGAWVRGIVINGANAGNLQFQFAQQAAEAKNHTVKAGSWLRMHLMN